MKPTFIDLFAGIGGMRMAFENAGARCVFTSEYDPFAQETYSANFKGDVAGDITAIPPRLIPRHDILLAGFPCQPFSIAGVSKKNSLGRLHGFKDPTQGTLFFNVKEIIATRRPAAFLLENVKHLLRHDRGNTFRVIRDSLENELGYFLPEPRVLDASNLVPQHRERVFIVGFRSPREFHWPEVQKASPRLGQILQQEAPEKYTLSDHLWNYLQTYAAKHKAKGNGFGFGRFGPHDVARTLSARYFKDGSEILIDQGDRNPRRLTPRECARLMGFPDTFKIPVSDTRAYKQFGNSVVVPLVQKVACEIVKALHRPALRGKARAEALRSGRQLTLQLAASRSRPRKFAASGAP
jgi:DNA (cytosine-5)-methyltransferase 1